MDINEKISKLTGLWYSCLISFRKDRDCHFTITKTWSYDGKMKYDVDHYGYVADEFHEQFNHEQAAYEFLANKIDENIRKLCSSEIQHNQEIPEFSDAPTDHWQKILDELNKIADNT